MAHGKQKGKKENPGYPMKSYAAHGFSDYSAAPGLRAVKSRPTGLTPVPEDTWAHGRSLRC